MIDRFYPGLAVGQTAEELGLATEPEELYVSTPENTPNFWEMP